MLQDTQVTDLELPPEVVVVDNQASSRLEELPITENEDGSVVIDLKPLAPVPIEEQCLERDPNPLDNAIVVCRRSANDQRLTSTYGPIDALDDFGTAVPRARVKLSDDAEAEANAINKAVGGFNANGGEVRVKIDF